MRILAFSDVRRWEGYEDLVDEYKPDIVALAGDLTSDGVAAFWSEALQLVPEFAKRKSELLRRYGLVEREKHYYAQVAPPERFCDRFFHHLSELEDRYQKTKAFLEARKKIHVDKFYAFLRYAGKVSKVLVTKGDHDDDFAGDYDSSRINRIAGCREISGKAYISNRCMFLGLGFDQAGYRSPLRALIADFKDRVGIVIAHAPQRNVRLIAEMGPKLLVRGHFGSGQYLVDGIPTVFTAGLNHTVIEIVRTGLPRIRQFGSTSFSDHTIRELKRDSSSVRYLRREYRWLRPFPRSAA